MINNRIFEALACGSIVATEYMKEIETYVFFYFNQYIIYSIHLIFYFLFFR
jgi:spore maturation protein CgeB